MTTPNTRDVIVVGAGIIGLTTAVLLARSGHRVTVLDRDGAAPPTDAASAWDSWSRPGVSQFHQPHMMLPRWHHEMQREFPELADGLLANGAQRVNLLHLQAPKVSGGWQPGDEQFTTVTARRPVLEAALCKLLVRHQENLTLRRGVTVTGLQFSDSGGVPQVRGVRTSAGDIAADVVVDAAGRHTRIPRWIGERGAAPVMDSEPSGFIYYGRHYRSHDGRTPQGMNQVLTHYPSLSVLTLPCDGGTYCLALVTSSEDRALRSLRHEPQWLAAVGACPAAAHWAAQGTPMTPVTPIAGIQDIRRSYVRDAVPVAVGVFAVGDSSAATNPSLGRGAAIGVIQACVLRDVLAGTDADPYAQALAFDEATRQRVSPWVDAALRFDRHRLAEMQADVDAVPYVTDDPSWAMTTALIKGAAADPVLARASSRIGGVLAAPQDVFAEPATRERIGPYLAMPRYPAAGPSRADVLQALTDARSSAKTPVLRAPC